MELPNADQARVDREKVTDYLLNREHRSGAAKAAFFAQFGFALDSWEMLAEALREHGRLHQVAATIETRYGLRFVVEGPLRCPDGRWPQVRSVWQLDHDEVAPRLITAYSSE